jgi:hypothetical protein
LEGGWVERFLSECNRERFSLNERLFKVVPSRREAPQSEWALGQGK